MAGAITRWDPFSDLAELRGRFDRLLGEFGEGRDREWIPAIDVLRSNGELVVRADVPGIKPEEIKVEVEGGVLTLSGKHEERTEETEQHVVRRERRYGAFSRSMTLPEGIDADAIEAKTKDGVLEVKIPLPKDEGKRTVSITPTAGE